MTTPTETVAPIAPSGRSAVTRFGKKSRRIQFILLCILVPVFTIPFYVMFMAAFKTSQHVDVTTMWLPPNPLSWEGMREAWTRLSPNFMNSVMIVVPATVISSLLGSFNGYLLSKFTFRFSSLMFTMMLVGMFIPYQSIIIPLVKFLNLIHLYGTIPGLVLVHVVYGIPITTLIFRNFYVGIPKEIVEAASMDGAGILRTFVSVIVPISIPGFVVAGIFQFTNIWNDFLFGIITISRPGFQPITVALNNLSGTQTVDWNVLMAGALIAAIPTAVVYLGLGRYFIQGLTAGSVK